MDNESIYETRHLKLFEEPRTPLLQHEGREAKIRNRNRDYHRFFSFLVFVFHCNCNCIPIPIPIPSFSRSKTSRLRGRERYDELVLTCKIVES